MVVNKWLVSLLMIVMVVYCISTSYTINKLKKEHEGFKDCFIKLGNNDKMLLLSIKMIVKENHKQDCGIHYAVTMIHDLTNGSDNFCKMMEEFKAKVEKKLNLEE